MRTHLRRLIVAPSLAMIFAASLFPTIATAASAPITFNVQMYDQCVGGKATLGSTVDFVWRDNGGNLKAQASVAAHAVTGTWSFCSSDPAVVTVPGDSLKADDGTYVRKFTLPNLTAVMDRATDRAHGTGPANRTIRLCSTFAIFGDFEKCYSVRVHDDGTWSYNPNTDIVGGMFASVNWKSPKGDHLTVFANAAQLRVTLGAAGFSGIGDPLTTIDFSLDGAVDATAHVVTSPSGSFSGEFRDNGGHLVKVKPGDHLTAPALAADEDWVMPHISATADRVTDVVSGNCEDTGTASQTVMFEVKRSGHNIGAGITNREPDGSFSIDLGEDAGGFFSTTNLKAGDRVLVKCEQMTGDFAQLKIVVP